MKRGFFRTALKVVSYIKYLIPNLFTSLSILFAYMAAVEATDVVDACWYLLLCVLMDKMDGTSARVLKATSKFGLKYDSIADAIAFGILPGIIIYEASTLVASHGHWAYLFKISAVVYIVATFARLYKFDRMATSEDAPDSFFGIPSTLSAAVIACYCVAFGPYFEQQIILVFLLPMLGLGMSVLMNGNFPTLKVGIPRKKLHRVAQTFFGIVIFVAIPTRKAGMILFVLAMVAMYITIVHGRKKYKEQISENSAKERDEVLEDRAST